MTTTCATCEHPKNLHIGNCHRAMSGEGAMTIFCSCTAYVAPETDTPGPFAVDLICCGMREPRSSEFDTWDEADAYRRDWEESGKSDTAIGHKGHERKGIIRAVTPKTDTGATAPTVASTNDVSVASQSADKSGTAAPVSPYTDLLALAEAATPGPWMLSDTDGVITWSTGLPHPVMIVGRGKDLDGVTPIVVVPDGLDAAYIAACSPDVVRRLIADLQVVYADLSLATEQGDRYLAEMKAASRERIGGIGYGLLFSLVLWLAIGLFVAWVWTR